MVTRRERLREATREEIKAIARDLMAEEGTTVLSLREIARRMGVTVTALYRYFPGRDDLITALIVDAYHSHAKAVEQASQQPGKIVDRLIAVMMAYRQWALDHPTEYILIYGNPVPGYHAPSEITTPAARRSLEAFLRIFQEASAEGQMKLPDLAEFPPHYEEFQRQWAQANIPGIPDSMITAMVLGWSQIHGLIGMELFHHIQPLIGDPGPLYEYQVKQMLRGFGLKIET
jgi:AcrR family transcriptional regulator